jgi:uncharacterized damage-inducible protein DinB
MQTAVSVIKRLHQHRAWVNKNLLAAAAELSNAQLRQEFAIGQGSVWKSLVHMMAAEYNWLEALIGNDDPLFPGDVRGKLPGNQLGEGGIATFGELREAWQKMEKRWQEYLESMTDASLDDMVAKTSTIMPPGQRLMTRRLDILLHVCTHAHYTAAQVVNMLRQLGVEKLPPTMMISLARQEQVSA